jgi:hypothetical protein
MCGDSRLDLQPQSFDPFGHVSGGLHLVETGLGDAVQIPPVRDHMVFFRLNELTQGIHGDILFFAGW